MALSGFLKSGKVCFSDFCTHTFVMFRLIPGIFGHAQIMLTYFLNIKYYFKADWMQFYVQLIHFSAHIQPVLQLLPACRVITVYCLISIEFRTVCSSREDGCSILSRESIGKSCPQGQDWSILPCWQGCTHNPSLQNGIDVKQCSNQSFPGDDERE